MTVDHRVRRREVGFASARSLLLTVLGEFVHPRHVRCGRPPSLEALAALGVEEKSARQALTRTASRGDAQLRAARPPGALGADPARATTCCEEGTRRIYGFMRERHPWDGRWLVLSVPIPETQRQLRHRLRTRLTWLGLGSPDVRALGHPRRQPRPTRCTSRGPRPRPGRRSRSPGSGRPAGIGDERRLLADAWDLAERRGPLPSRSCADFEIRSRRPTCRGVRRPGRDGRRSGGGSRSSTPTCPRELLDHDWPGPRAAAAFHDLHAALAPPRPGRLAVVRRGRRPARAAG